MQKKKTAVLIHGDLNNTLSVFTSNTAMIQELGTFH